MSNQLHSGAWWVFMVVCVLALCGTVAADEEPLVPTEKGPRLEGYVLTSPHHNLRWVVPEGSAFEWSRFAEDESRKNIEIAAVFAEEDTSRCTICLHTNSPGKYINTNYKDDAHIEHLGEGTLDSVVAGTTRDVNPVRLGNLDFHMLEKRGKSKDEECLFRSYYIYLRGEVITLDMVFLSDGVESLLNLAEDADAVAAGLEFIDAEAWAVGPVGVNGVNASDCRPVDSAGEERTARTGEVVAVKPGSMADVVLNAEDAHPYHRFGWETWNADRTAYLYFDVYAVPLREIKTMEGTSRLTLDWRLKCLEQELPGVEIDCTKKRGERLFSARFLKAKALAYGLRAAATPYPIVEEGFFIKRKKHWYMFRFHYVGADAKKEFRKLRREIERGLKFN